jgi:hypothetical protein
MQATLAALHRLGLFVVQLAVLAVLQVGEMVEVVALALVEI